MGGSQRNSCAEPRRPATHHPGFQRPGHQLVLHRHAAFLPSDRTRGRLYAIYAFCAAVDGHRRRRMVRASPRRRRLARWRADIGQAVPGGQITPARRAREPRRAQPDRFASSPPEDFWPSSERHLERGPRRGPRAQGMGYARCFTCDFRVAERPSAPFRYAFSASGAENLAEPARAIHFLGARWQAHQHLLRDLDEDAERGGAGSICHGEGAADVPGSRSGTARAVGPILASKHAGEALRGKKVRGARARPEHFAEGRKPDHAPLSRRARFAAAAHDGEGPHTGRILPPELNGPAALPPRANESAIQQSSASFGALLAFNGIRFRMTGKRCTSSGGRLSGSLRRPQVRASPAAAKGGASVVACTKQAKFRPAGAAATFLRFRPSTSDIDKR